jgi:hypothetical protein
MVLPSGVFAFGAPGARGRVELYASHADKVYLNNRATTETADFKRVEFGGAVYVRVAPKTYAVLDARSAKVDYKLPNIAEGTERKYFGGIAWEATAATTGTLKFGRLTRKSDLDGAEVKETSWEAIASWAPRTYSTFDLVSSRYTSEPSGLGRFIVTSATSLGWNHAWRTHLTTSVVLRRTRDEYQGFARTDDTTSIGFKVGYRMRPWLTLGAEYTYITRDSNIEVYEYDRNIYFISATASM